MQQHLWHKSGHLAARSSGKRSHWLCKPRTYVQMRAQKQDSGASLDCPVECNCVARICRHTVFCNAHVAGVATANSPYLTALHLQCVRYICALSLGKTTVPQQNARGEDCLSKSKLDC